MINNIIEKNWFVLLACFIVSIMSMALFSISTSPLTPFEGLDACVFKQMGETLLQGNIPYYDLFDHKGPVIYFINALGLGMTSGRWGLFLLVVANCTVVLYTWYKTAINFTNSISAYFATGLTLLTYLTVMEEGNMTEDWSLLPLSYALYLVSCKLAHNKDINLWQYLLLGVFAGVVMFIRANNLALLISSVFYVSYTLLIEKKYMNLIMSYLMMGLGCLFVVVICSLFFYLNYGSIGVEQMIYGTFLFNLGYGSWNSYYDFFVSSMINHAYFLAASVVVILAYTNNKEDKQRNIVTLFILLSFLFCFFTMGRTAFRHYLITVVPLFAFGSAYAFRNSFKSYGFFIVVGILIAEPFLKKQAQFTLGEVKREYKTFYERADDVISNIPTADRNEIWNYNAEMTGIGILQHNKIIQCNRVVLNFQRNNSKELQKSENGKLQRVHPKYLLVNFEKNYVLKDDSAFIASNYNIVKELSMDVSSKNAEVHENIAILKHK